MMTIKHTPGPWVCLEGDKQVYSSAGVICQRFTGATAQPAKKNWRANSKLIAAAPELLEALEGVKQCGFDDEDGSGWGVIHITRGDWDAVLAAIAKAKGQQHD